MGRGKRFRSLFVAFAATVTGCNLFQTFILSPTDLSIVSGGITDQRPFWGRVRLADWPNLETGDFLLATCGCGEWRALVLPEDGSARFQLAVHFYSEGPYDPAGDVMAYGTTESEALSGMVHQDEGHVEGRVQSGFRRLLFNAERRETHTDSAETCVICHIGEDPIWPQPPGHPAYQLDPPNCLSCHTVVIE